MSGRIDIVYDDGHSHSFVEVAGEFTDWQPVPLGLDTGTRYAAIFDGAVSGQRYQYKFIVDGHWTLLKGYPTITDNAGFVNHPIVATVVAAPESTQGAAPEAQSAASQQRGIEQPADKSATIPSGFGSYQYTEERLSDPIENVRGQSVARDELAGGELAGGDLSQSTPYELKNTQLDEPTERVDGLDQLAPGSATQQRDLGSYELRESQLADPVERIPGALQPGAVSKSAAEPYNYDGSQLDEPTERVPGLDKLDRSAEVGAQVPSQLYDYKSTGGLNADKGIPNNRVELPLVDESRLQGYNAQLQPGDGEYEYTGSELKKPVERVPGLDQFTQQQSTLPGNGEYEYTASELKEPVERVPGLGEFSHQQSKLPQSGNGEYEYTASELKEPVERVPGLGEFAQQQSKLPQSGNGEYEYTGSELKEPVERVPGLGEFSHQQSKLPQSGNGEYEYTASELKEPVERVPGLGEFSHQQSKLPQSGNGEYEYTGSELKEPVERVPGLNEFAQQQSTFSHQQTQQPSQNFGSYDYKETQLDHPVDSARKDLDLSNQGGIPGSLPYEQNTYGHVTPQQVTDSTLKALGGEQNKEYDTGVPLGATSSGGYGDSDFVDAQSSHRVDGINDNSFNDNYESAAENFSDSEVLAAAVSGAALSKTPAQVPSSVSDRTISQQLVNETKPGATRGESDLDINAAERAVKDAGVSGTELRATNADVGTATAGTAEPTTRTISDTSTSAAPTTTDESLVVVPPIKTTTGASASSTSSPVSQSSAYGARRQQQHVPIDVSTGFPVDDPNGESSPAGSQRQRSHGGQSLRQESRRPVSYAGVPVSQSVQSGQPSNENRNAAVIAAAAKASAYAKQDVAAISNPQQSQQSPQRLPEERKRPLSAFGHGHKSSASGGFLGHGHKPSSGTTWLSGTAGSPESAGVSSHATGAAGATGSSTAGDATGAVSSGSAVDATPGSIPSGLSAETARGKNASGRAEGLERSQSVKLTREGTKKESKVKRFFKKLSSK